MAEFSYNNSGETSIIMSSFEFLFCYDREMGYKDNRDLQLKFRIAE